MLIILIFITVFVVSTLVETLGTSMCGHHLLVPILSNGSVPLNHLSVHRFADASEGDNDHFLPPRCWLSQKLFMCLPCKHQITSYRTKCCCCLGDHCLLFSTLMAQSQMHCYSSSADYPGKPSECPCIWKVRESVPRFSMRDALSGSQWIAVTMHCKLTLYKTETCRGQFLANVPRSASLSLVYGLPAPAIR